MSFLPTAAAAQAASFRPCLRCRPECAPDSAAWRGTSTTVSRPLSLIESGALDAGAVDLLASRLGIGERHLRRLFREHVGASPVEIAVTRRVLLALQLIRDTPLSMADVALALGFGSIRRFNEIIRGLFRRPPRALRHGSDARASLPAQGLVIQLPYRPPYNWPAMISFLKARAVPGLEAVSINSYARTIAIDGVHGIIAVEPTVGHALQVTIQFPRVAALPVIIHRTRRLFDVGGDPDAIDTHLATDPALASLVAARRGVRVPGAWDGFELSVRAFLGQHITVRGAVRLTHELVLRCGERLTHPQPGPSGFTHVFPTAERLASADLTTLGMPRARANAISALARAFTEAPELIGPGESVSDCVDRLRSLPGIGEWTAQYIAMRQLREPDAFPSGDVALQRGLARLEGRIVSARDLLVRAERWRPWRAYAAQHLWSTGTTSSASATAITPTFAEARRQQRRRRS